MSRRIKGTLQATRHNHTTILTRGSMLALILFMVLVPGVALADEGDVALNGWVLCDTTVVSMPPALADSLDLDGRTLDVAELVLYLVDHTGEF